jgi:4-hydroxy-tetrahydrodipicolinate synthase
VFTLFADDLTLDVRAMEAHLGRLDEAGLSTLLIGGNTGEFASLTAAELRQCFAIAGSVLHTPFLAGVGGPLETVAELCLAAAGDGALAAMVHEPLDPFASDSGLSAYYLAVADRSPLPLLLYLRGGSRIANDAIWDVLDHPRVAGVKDGRNDLQAFADGRFARPDAAWFCGGAERWAPLYAAAGSRGFSSGLVNLDCETPLRLATALDDGDTNVTWDLWRRVAAFEAIRNAGGGEANVTALKVAAGARFGTSAVVRPPLAPLSSAVVAEVQQAAITLLEH